VGEMVSPSILTGRTTPRRGAPCELIRLDISLTNSLAKILAAIQETSGAAIFCHGSSGLEQLLIVDFC